MMKKFLNYLNRIIFVCLMCVMLAALLSGCVVNKTSSERLNVVTVMFAQYDFARAVCGDYADVSMISKPGGDVHGYEPSLGDIKKIASADIFIYNGGESDSWVDSILNSIDNPELITIRMCDYVELICDENESGHSEHNHHHDHEHYDEHIQSSPKNAVLMIEAIRDAVCSCDSANSAIYRKNAEGYVSEINLIDKELEEITGKSRKNFMAVADRFPFVYMAEHYGIEYKALFSGCSQENDANPSVIIDMIEDVKSKNLPVVFYTELSSHKMADTVCSETGAKKLMLHSCEGISAEDFKNSVTYVEIMKKNLTNLREALL